MASRVLYSGSGSGNAETAGTDYQTTASGKRDGRSHGDRHRVDACLFFAENQERLRREVIGSVRSINIHGLLAVARESEGVKAVQDHVILYGDGLRYITDIVE